MKTLKEINFNDFVKLKRGYDLPNDKIVDGKYPVVASTSIKAFHKEYKVLPPSVVTGRSGSLGEVQFIDMPCWPLNTALYVKNFN
jgi:type I restriction enzyme S subunit